MKLIPLYGINGIGKFAQVDDEDYEFLMKWRWFGVWFGVSSNYYVVCNYNLGNGKWTNRKMHQLILDKKDGFVIDHIDGDGLNNQKHNLRYCTKLENSFNKTKYKNGSSEFKGVTFKKAKKEGWSNYWIARIQVNNKSIYIGKFPPTEDGKILAAKAYNEAAIKHHGEFAKTNDLSGNNTKTHASPIKHVKKEKTKLNYDSLLPDGSMAIQLNKGKFAIVSLEDYNFLRQFNWFLSSSGYAKRWSKRTHDGAPRKSIFMHKIIIEAKSNQIVDHVNRNKLDNRRCNLRIAMPFESSANTSVRTNKTSSRYFGVFYCKWKSSFRKKDGAISFYETKRWKTSITFKGKQIHIGTFPYTADGEIRAAIAYNKKAIELKGEFANLNIISPLPNHSV